MAEIKQLKEKKTDEIFYPVTVGEAVIFEDGRSLKDKIEKLGIYIETTYSNLKSLRDDSQLIPGALYRITDYVTTTVQENTRSAGHQFDIIVQAISESVLSEDARAIQHKYTEEDKLRMSYAFNDDGVKCTYSETTYLTLEDARILTNVYISGGEDVVFEDVSTGKAKTLSFDGDIERLNNGEFISFGYTLNDFDHPTGRVVHEADYFSNSNLAAWKLKYCLDNDTDRFAWAQRYETIVSWLGSGYSGPNGVLHRVPSVDASSGTYKYAWGTDDDISDSDPANFVYSKNEVVHIGDTVYNAVQAETEIVYQVFFGRGVIYQMIDEHNNNCPYDFKNIQFLRSSGWHNEHTDWAEEVIGEDPDMNIYYYTFSWANNDFSIEDVSVVGKKDNANVLKYAEDNIINNCFFESNKHRLWLNNIILVSSSFFDNGYYSGIWNNVFGYGCYNCTFGNQVGNNVFDTEFFNNIMTNEIYNNKSFGDICSINRTGGSTENKIIYMVSNTACFKDIEDAFSNT